MTLLLLFCCIFRLMFATLMIIAAGFTVSLMIQAWINSRHSITTTNIETLQFPLWNLTHPAVYICSFNKISLMALHRVVDHWLVLVFFIILFTFSLNVIIFTFICIYKLMIFFKFYLLKLNLIIYF